MKDKQMKPSKRLIAVGSAVKAGPDGVVSGVLVRFTSPKEKDAAGEYFDAQTDFYSLDGTRPVIWYHGWSSAVKGNAIGTGTLSRTARGIEISARLDTQKPEAKRIYSRAVKGELGWSSDSADHLLDVAGDGRIRRWPIVAASLAPAHVVKDSKALAVVGVKAFRQAAKAGGIAVSPVDLAILGALKSAFQDMLNRLGDIIPKMSPSPATMNDVIRGAAQIGDQIENWERQVAVQMSGVGVKAGRIISSANRDLIQTSVSRISDEIMKLQELLDATEPVTPTVDSPTPTKAALADDDDIALALALASI